MVFNPNNLVKVFQAGDPFADDPPDADIYYATMGRIVVLWGRFEQLLEQTISLMGNVPDAITPKKPPPTQFSKKLERIKILCRDTPSLKGLQDDIRSFASAAAILAPRRHGLTHANWQGFSQNALEPTVIFTNIKWSEEKDDLYERRPISLSDLKTLLADIAMLNNDLFDKGFNNVMRVIHKASLKPEE